MTTPSDKAARELMYTEFLAAEGYLPERDQDDFVTFTRGGRKYGIPVDDDDECFIVMRPVLDLEGDLDPDQVRSAALLANRETGVAKLYIDETLLVAAAQQYCIPPASFQAVFSRCLTAIDEVSAAFRKHMGT